MPFFKNVENKVVQVYDAEVQRLVESGWKALTEAEEVAHRELLAADHALTNAAAIEKVRVEAGLYAALGQAQKQPTENAGTDATETAPTAPAAPTDGGESTGESTGESALSATDSDPAPADPAATDTTGDEATGSQDDNGSEGTQSQDGATDGADSEVTPPTDGSTDNAGTEGGESAGADQNGEEGGEAAQTTDDAGDVANNDENATETAPTAPGDGEADVNAAQ